MVLQQALRLSEEWAMEPLSLQAEAHRDGSVNLVHLLLVQAAHVFAQAPLIDGTNLL